MSDPSVAVDHDRRAQAIIFNTLSTQSRALRLDLSLTDRDAIANTIVARLASHGYAITHADAPVSAPATSAEPHQDQEKPMSTIAGHCPMGCGQTLFVGEGGHITCSRLECPRPWAVDDLLMDSETEHVVQFEIGSFTIRHPLRERLGDALMSCELHEYVQNLDGPPVAPGRYRALRVDDGWTWETAGGSA